MHDIANDALNETNAAIERMNKTILRAQEDCRDEIVAIELRRIARHGHRMRQFEGSVPESEAPGEAIRSEPSAEEPKPLVAITAPRQAPRPVELLNDEGPHAKLPRVLERPSREAN